MSQYDIVILTPQNPRNQKNTNAHQNLYQDLPTTFWMGPAAFTHTFCICKNYSPKERVWLEVLSWLHRELNSAPHPPSLHTDFLRKKKKNQDNQARGQCLQRSHSHCSEKTCHLHHSPHAISSEALADWVVPLRTSARCALSPDARSSTPWGAAARVIFHEL